MILIHILVFCFVHSTNKRLLCCVVCTTQESCDLDATDEVAGHTALHLATQQGNSRVVETLVAYGTKMNLKDNEGAAPIHRAYLANDVTPFDEFTPQIKKVDAACGSLYFMYIFVL